jgi:type IV secretion system protein VirB5
MLTPKFRLAAACVVASLVFAPTVRAQWSVIDIPAIAQLIKQVQAMQQQLMVAGNQLQSARQTLQSITGDRGMALLLSGTVRNYLPTDWAQVADALLGRAAGGYAGLSTEVRTAMVANAVLSPQRLSTLSPVDQQQIQSARQSSALQQALAGEELANASNRFASIQSLIAAISTATDQKAILELQARITAELGMLENEQTKLHVLYQATQAEESTIRQQVREHVVDEHGRFETRFRPVP